MMLLLMRVLMRTAELTVTRLSQYASLHAAALAAKHAIRIQSVAWRNPNDDQAESRSALRNPTTLASSAPKSPKPIGQHCFSMQHIGSLQRRIWSTRIGDSQPPSFSLGSLAHVPLSSSNRGHFMQAFGGSLPPSRSLATAWPPPVALCPAHSKVNALRDALAHAPQRQHRTSPLCAAANRVGCAVLAAELDHLAAVSVYYAAGVVAAAAVDGDEYDAVAVGA